MPQWKGGVTGRYWGWLMNIPKGQAAPNSLKNGVHPRALKEGTTILMRDEKKKAPAGASASWPLARINMFPEKGPFQKENEIVFQPIHFQGDLRSFFGAPYFFTARKRGGISPTRSGAADGSCHDFSPTRIHPYFRWVVVKYFLGIRSG